MQSKIKNVLKREMNDDLFNISIFCFRYRPHHHDGPARVTDSRLLRHPGRQPVRRAGRTQVDPGEYSGMEGRMCRFSGRWWSQKVSFKPFY
jgi:hypothetical protein